MRREIEIGLGIAIWFGSALAGFWAWHDYDATPAAAGIETSDSEFRRATLTMFVHPHCPCSRASLSEFAKVAQDIPSGYRCEVVFVCPPDAPDDWERGSLWEAAANLPGVKVRLDRAGNDAVASGLVVLTDESGRVRFRGGITRGRGVLGDSSGQRALRERLHGKDAEVRESPVFGCPLLAARTCAETGGAPCPK